MELRAATMNDAELLLQWRKIGERSSWYRGRHVDAAAHYKWLERRLDPASLCRIWIAEHDGQRVGVARLDSNDELSYTGHQDIIPLVLEHAEGRVKAALDGDDPRCNSLLNAGFRELPDVRFFLW